MDRSASARRQYWADQSRGEAERMAHIQFELGQPSHERHFTSILQELGDRGHKVSKTSNTRDCPGFVKRAVAAGDHRERTAFEAFVRDDVWGPLSYLVRSARDYVRYRRPEHANSLIIKSRMRNMLTLGYEGGDVAGGEAMAALLDQESDVASLQRLDGVLAAIEQSIPPHPEMLNYVRGLGADVACVTPMLMTQYGQTDLIKALRAVGVPIVFMVGSWDNLTTKGTTHVLPDFTFVWNEIQRKEAAQFHDIDPNSVRVVGAARFDEFWEREIEIPYAEFCRSHGLDPARATIAYLCSSNLISSDERGFVERWINAIRSSRDAALEDANILIRPHPKFSSQWIESFSGRERIGVSVSKGLNNDPTLYHCLAHARAVVAVNTSAELEAAILERPVFTVHDSEFVTGQSGTIHFEYLAGSLARVADDLSQHISQLAAEMAGEDVKGRNAEFLQSFLRPGGLNRRAAAVTADAIEEIISKVGAQLADERALLSAAAR